MSLISLAPEEVRAPGCGSEPSHYTLLPVAGEVVLRAEGHRWSQIGYRTSTFGFGVGQCRWLRIRAPRLTGNCYNAS